ncbi:MAG: hypothetical protein HY600_05425, partial [Candidatus Omnitrophica bacterium]|nr:hypothetical protein [Candidatus Omnitrophota bacterium]
MVTMQAPRFGRHLTAVLLALALGLPGPAVALRPQNVRDAAGLEESLRSALASFQQATPLTIATTILDVLLAGDLQFLVSNRNRQVSGEELMKPGRYRAAVVLPGTTRRVVCGLVMGQQLYISPHGAAPWFG